MANGRRWTPERERRRARPSARAAPLRNAAVRPWRTALPVALPAALLALVTALGTLRYGFVQDDFFLVPANPQIRSLANLPEIFATPYSRYAGLAGMTYDWRPLPIATFCVEYRLVADDPWLYHLDNVLLHAAASALVALLAWRITGDPWPATMTGVLFALMPVHADNVANITERSGLLAAGFGFAFLLGHGARSSGARAAAGAALFLALLSKESAVAFPVLALLIDFRERASFAPRPLLSRWLPAAVALGAWFALRAALIGGVAYQPGLHYFHDVPVERVLPTMGRFFLQSYLAPCLLAFHRSSDYSFRSFPTSAADDLLGWIALAVATAAGVALFIRFLRARSPAVLGALWFLAALLPVANLLVRILVIGAERLLYAPSFGLALAGGAIAARLTASDVPRLRRTLAAGIAVLYVAGSALGLLEGYSGWRSERAFYDGVLASCPENVLALSGRALLAREPEDFPQALEDAERAIRIAPSAPEMRYALGWTLLHAGFPEAAAFAARQGIALDAHALHKGHSLLAQCLQAQGDDAGAFAAYGDVLRLRPNDGHARHERTAIVFASGTLLEAYDDVRAARAADPDHPWSAALQARVLAHSGRAEEGELVALRPPLGNPEQPPTLVARAGILLETGNPVLAVDLLRRAIERDPDARLAHAWLAEALERTRDREGAEAERIRSRPGGRSLWREMRRPPDLAADRRRAERARVLGLTLDLPALLPLAEEIRRKQD